MKDKIIYKILIGIFLLLILLPVLVSAKEKKIILIKDKVNSFNHPLHASLSLLKQNKLAEARKVAVRLKSIAIEINDAEIPPRLTQNKTKIDKQKQSLLSATEEYDKLLKASESGVVDSTMMLAFHEMDKFWRQINKSIRIDVPEISEFHDVLDPMWHVYFPNNDIEAIREAAPELKQKAEKFEQIKWPEMLLQEVDEDSINENLKKLEQAVSELAKACQNDSDKIVKQKISKVQQQYKFVKMMQ